MNMIAIILAGGLGTRISNETTKKPKPLILINSKPIISYIISHYRKYHINKFIIAGGYKFKKLSQYFDKMKDDNLFFDKKTSNKIEDQTYNKFLKSSKKNKLFIKVVNTGLKTQTGGRIMKLKNILKEQNQFFLTYGDGISNINIKKTYNQFQKKNILHK